MTYRCWPILIATAVLTACSSASRIEPELPAPLVEFSASAQARELWNVDVGSLRGDFDAALTPVLDGDTLYIANANGQLRAMKTDSGRTAWVVDLNVPITGATAFGDGLVVVGTRKGIVIALDATSGEKRWMANVSSEVGAPAAIRRGYVVVQTIDGKVTGLNSGDGKRLWVFDRAEPALSLHGTSSPVILADFVLAGFASGKIVALAIKDGKLLWEHTVAPPKGRNEVERLVDVDAPLLLWGDTLFATAYQGKVVAIDMRGGRILWSRDVSSYVGMDADRTSLFVTDEKGNVLAFDPRGGSTLWRQDKLHGRKLSGPTLHDNTIVVGDFEGYLHWLARDDGRLLARHRLDSAAVRVRGIADGKILYVASQDGRLAALQLTQSP